MATEENEYADEGDSMFTLRLNNQNYLTSPLYGKTFLLCRCCQRFDIPSNSRNFMTNLQSHLKTWKCFVFEDIKDKILEYLKLVEEKKQSNDYWAPLSLETIFDIPPHVSKIDGTLCRFCHKIQAEKNRSRCCQEMMKFKVKIYGSINSSRKMTLLLHSIVDNSFVVKEYLDKAHNRKQLKDQIKDLEDQILCLQTDKAILVHENTLLKGSNGVESVLDNLAHGIIELPSLEAISEGVATARVLYNEVPNPNLVLTDGEFIRKIFNFPRNISNDELLKLHQSFRGTSSHPEQTLANVSLAMMQLINSTIDENKGPVASRITGLCGSKAEDFNGRPFTSITSQSLRKYNQVFAKPFIIYVYRSDANFKKDVDDLHSNYVSYGNEEDRKLQFARILKTILMHFTRLLQDHSPTNTFFKFLQNASVVAKFKENEPTSTHPPVQDDDEDDDVLDDEVDTDVQYIQAQTQELEHRATTCSNITLCKPSTLNVLLSAARYFCFGVVLISWKGFVPLDNHLQAFRVGMIFHQIASLLHQVQSRREQIQAHKHSIFLKFDEQSKLYSLVTIEGAVDVLKFRQAYLKLFSKFRTQFEILLDNYNGEQGILDQFKEILTDLLDPSTTLQKKDFIITTANNEPLLKGSGFTTFTAVVENAFQNMSLENASKFVENFKALVLALTHFTSGSNVRHFDLCRLFVSRYAAESGSLQFASNFGIVLNSASSKVTKSSNMFSLFFARANVLINYGFYILTEKLANKLIDKIQQDFQFTNQEDKELYARRIRELLFQQQYSVEYGELLRNVLNSPEECDTLPPFSEVPSWIHILEPSKLNLKENLLRAVERDIFELQGAPLGRFRKIWSNFNTYVSKFIRNMIDVNKLPQELKSKVDELDADALHFDNECRTQNDVSYHQEGVRNVYYSARQQGSSVPAQAMFKMQQNLEFKKIFFQEHDFGSNNDEIVSEMEVEEESLGALNTSTTMIPSALNSTTTTIPSSSTINEHPDGIAPVPPILSTNLPKINVPTQTTSTTTTIPSSSTINEHPDGLSTTTTIAPVPPILSTNLPKINVPTQTTSTTSLPSTAEPPLGTNNSNVITSSSLQAISNKRTFSSASTQTTSTTSLPSTAEPPLGTNNSNVITSSSLQATSNKRTLSSATSRATLNQGLTEEGFKQLVKDFSNLAIQFDYRVKKTNVAQSQIIEWYLKKQSNDCIIRCGTGSGKTSLMILLTKFSPKTVNIFMVPFKALLDSIIIECERFKVVARPFTDEVFTNNALEDEGTIVVCCYEQFDIVRFRTLVKQLQKDSLLGRIIIDEVHNCIEKVDLRSVVSVISLIHNKN
jgi:hypothetical protein